MKSYAIKFIVYVTMIDNWFPEQLQDKSLEKMSISNVCIPYYNSLEDNNTLFGKFTKTFTV